MHLALTLDMTKNTTSGTDSAIATAVNDMTDWRTRMQAKRAANKARHLAWIAEQDLKATD